MRAAPLSRLLAVISGAECTRDKCTTNFMARRRPITHYTLKRDTPKTSSSINYYWRSCLLPISELLRTTFHRSWQHLSSQTDFREIALIFPSEYCSECFKTIYNQIHKESKGEINNIPRVSTSLAGGRGIRITI